MSHDFGHLWHSVVGLTGDPHANPLHLLSEVLIFGGCILLTAAWRLLHRAEAQHALAWTGIYARLRYPQYAAFIAIMFGFLLQWFPRLGGRPSSGRPMNGAW